MAETQAASSPAETPDVFEGQQVSMAEFTKYRADGTLPERLKPVEQAESTTADSPEKTVAVTDEPESEPEDAQEKPLPPKSTPADKRIRQLLDEKKELQRKLDAAAKPTQTDSSTAQAQQQAPQNFQEWYQHFDVDKWEEDYTKSHPDASYARMQLDEKLFVDGAKDHFKDIEQRVTAERQSLEAKVSEARNKYENFDEIKTNFLAKVVSDKGTPLIPLPVLGIINDSDYLADLLYTIGSDDAELAKFVEMAKTNPNKAIRYVARVEGLIAEELAKGKATTPRGEDGKFKAPEPKRTSAPKPPEPVGGGSSRAFDTSDESLSPDDWMRKRNKQLGIG